MPSTPPANVVASDSSRNCSRISRRFAPSALRTPISRVRSCTLTNMMFMMPTPPIASVSTPMNVSTIFRPPTMPLVISCVFSEPNMFSARSSAGL